MNIKPKNAFLVSLAGTVAIALCCFTPILVVIFIALGLSVIVPYLDFVLFPALFILIVVTAMAYLRWK